MLPDLSIYFRIRQHCLIGIFFFFFFLSICHKGTSFSLLQHQLFSCHCHNILLLRKQLQFNSFSFSIYLSTCEKCDFLKSIKFILNHTVFNGDPYPGKPSALQRLLFLSLSRNQTTAWHKITFQIIMSRSELNIEDHRVLPFSSLFSSSESCNCEGKIPSSHELSVLWFSDILISDGIIGLEDMLAD